MRLVLVSALFAVAGCNITGTEYTASMAESDRNTCRQLGATDATMYGCMSRQQEMRVAAEANRRQIAGQLSGVMLGQQQQQYRRPINCTSVQQGIYTNTNCF